MNEDAFNIDNLAGVGIVVCTYMYMHIWILSLPSTFIVININLQSHLCHLSQHRHSPAPYYPRHDLDFASVVTLDLDFASVRLA